MNTEPESPWRIILRREPSLLLQGILSVCLLFLGEVASTQAQTFRGTISLPPNHAVEYLAFSPDRSMLAAVLYNLRGGRFGFEVRLYDADTRKPLGRIPLPDENWGRWLANAATAPA
jgi:hypothetical protein